MLNKIRFAFTLSLIAVLLVSTFILSNPAKVKACPIPPPRTLLSLYLRSDVIFVANVTSEKDGKILSDEDDYFSVEIIRNLKISSIFKGNPKRNFIFTTTEYRDRKPSEDSTAENEEVDIFRYGYKGASRIKSGERYLFFFTENSETKNYELTDYVSGYKKLSDPDLAIFEKRIKELERIVEKKENQLEGITEWLVRCIEEPITRWDGLLNIKESFQVLKYMESEIKESDEKQTDEKEPFVIDEDFYSGTPEIAANLSDSQKERISSIVYSSIQDEISDFPFYYGLSNLVVNWDKPRLATYAYGFLQTANTTDAEKTKSIMEYIANVSEDEKLSELASGFPVNDEFETTDETIEEKTAEKSTVEEKTETISEPRTIIEESTEIVENVEQEQNVPVEKTETLKTSEKSAPPLAQKREKILQEFTSRYEYLLVRGFKADDEPVLAEK